MQQQRRIHGDDTADQLYQRYAPSLLAYLLHKTSSREDAEDLLLEVFLAVLERQDVLALGEYEQRAWLWAVARNKATDYHRNFSRHPQVPLRQVTDVLYSDMGRAPEQFVIEQEEYTQLHGYVQQLSALHQEVLRLRFGHGLKSAEIATVLEKSEGAVRMLLSRALKLLRVIYRKQ